MKSLEHHLSEVVSPYDEVEYDQAQVLLNQQLLFQKQNIIENIGTKNAKIQFDLNFNEVLQQTLSNDELQSFLGSCLRKMNEVYSLDTLIDYISREGILENKTGEVVDFLRYIIREDWVQEIAFSLPTIDMNIISDKQKIRDVLTAHYFDIQNKIINREDINPLLHFYFENCSKDSGIKTLESLVLSDLPGIVSAQLLKL